MNQILLPQKLLNDNYQSYDSYSIPYLQADIEGQCTLHKIQSIKLITWKYYLYTIVSLFTAGLLFLPCYWYPWLQMIIYYNFCPLNQCTHFYVTNSDDTITIVKKQCCQDLDPNTIYFINRYLKYVYLEGSFHALTYDYFQKVTQIFNSKGANGLSSQQINKSRTNFGIGAMQIPTPSCLILFIRQIIQPFFVFVVFSIILWYFQQYYYYAGVIAFTSIISVGINLWEIMSLNQKIFHMAYYQTQINVLRNETITKISSKQLVPGDIVYLKDKLKLPFDAILISGSLLINQCALTGQSVPIVKNGIDKLQLNSKQTVAKNSFLFQGTEVIQITSKNINSNLCHSKHGLMVLVIRTNFRTLKGQLIRIITFPKNRQMRFYVQSAKFLLFLFCFSVITYIFLAIKLIKFIPFGEVIFKFLDLIVISVPPGLPASMSVGIAYSINRLKSSGIYCISPDKIMLGGRVNLICFDKTGTLTQDSMGFYQFIPYVQNQFKQPLFPQSTLDIPNQDSNSIIQSIQYKHSLINMSTCHSIIMIQSSKQMVGDVMQIKLFEFSGFKFVQNNNLRESSACDQEIKHSKHTSRFVNELINLNVNVHKRFQFNSQVQRMSVIVSSNLDESYLFIYTKGSPQALYKIMDHSTVPHNYFDILKKYTSCGFRVLTITYKRIEICSQIDSLSREQLQTNLIFNGFQIFQNKLKQQTFPTIEILRDDAGMQMTIITGDNLLTAANIAFKSGIIGPSINLMICQINKNNNVQVTNFYEIHDPRTSKISRVSEHIQMKQRKVKTVSDFICSVQNFSNKIIEIGQKNNYIFCITGELFQKLSDLENLEFLKYVRVFARAKPNDKTKIVYSYQSIGKIVAMCGDGANDCGALKQADAGLSLSSSEASIAAPFTSKVPNISSMIQLIRQCRGGLSTNFSIFNIMALYSFVQYTSTVITEYFLSYPADFQYLYWDFFCNFVFLITLGYTQSAEKLSKSIPSDSLFRFTNITYVLTMFASQVGCQIAAIYLMSNPPFSEYINYSQIGGQQINLSKYDLQDTLVKVSVQSTTVFLVSNFMYLFSVLAFCASGPWKKPFYTNKIFMCVFIIMFSYSTLICVWQQSRIPLLNLLNLDIRFTFMLMILGIGIGMMMFATQKHVLQKIFARLKQKFQTTKWL